METAAKDSRKEGRKRGRKEGMNTNQSIEDSQGLFDGVMSLVRSSALISEQPRSHLGARFERDGLDSEAQSRQCIKRWVGNSFPSSAQNVFFISPPPFH